MKLFELYRYEDESGISGTGVVAQGVVFDDGTVAMRWTTVYKSTSLYQSVEELCAIHGHNGKTTIVWMDSKIMRAFGALSEEQCV